MAFSVRRLSKFNQLYAGQSILKQEYAVPVRNFSKEAAPPVLKGDQMLKDIFLDIKKKFDVAMSVFRKERIIIDPDDPAAVAQYANVLKIVREKTGILSESEKLKQTIETQTKGIPDARSHLVALKEIRIKLGVVDDLGAEAMMLEALDKVEGVLKKPLLRSDAKGMALLMAEFDKGNAKLGFRREDLAKYEEELELKIAKEQLIDLKKEAIEAMETQLKREEFKGEQMPNTRDLDVRNFL